MIKTWVEDKSGDFPLPVYSPINLETKTVIVGLMRIGSIPDGDELVGEYAYDENGFITIHLRDGETE